LFNFRLPASVSQSRHPKIFITTPTDIFIEKRNFTWQINDDRDVKIGIDIDQEVLACFERFF